MQGKHLLRLCSSPSLSHELGFCQLSLPQAGVLQEPVRHGQGSHWPPRGPSFSLCIQFIVLLSFKLVLSSIFGETMASKLPKVPGQSSAEGAGKSVSATVRRPEQWGQALQSACLRLTPPQGVLGLKRLLSLALPGQGRCRGGREDVAGY